MSRVRRSSLVLFHLEDSGLLDVREILAGRISLEREAILYGVSLLAGRTYRVSTADFAVFRRVPADRWTPVERVCRGSREDRVIADGLVEKGFLLADEEEGRAAEYRRRHDLLASHEWDLYAAFFHFMTKWRGLSLPDVPAERFARLIAMTDEFVARYGEPPPHFHAVKDPADTIELPLVERNGGLFAALAARRTTRGFDRDRPLSREAFATVLYYVFGCHGIIQLHEKVTVIRRTSPSGGGLHPIEPYLLAIDVEGVPPGLYHYEAERHRLAALENLERDEARALAGRFTIQQPFPPDAHALVVLAARFQRSYWKYRRNARAYSVILMDAGHLSQTFYLVCAALGLGAFVTAAINGADIEERLGLDPASNGALAVCGCGVPSPAPSPLEPRFQPYVPQRAGVS